MALGDATGQRAGILRLERHDPVVDVGQDLARSELERLARIEGDDVTDVLRHNEGVERGLRRSRRGGQGEETEQGDERARESVPGHAYRMYRNASALLLKPITAVACCARSGTAYASSAMRNMPAYLIWSPNTTKRGSDRFCLDVIPGGVRRSCSASLGRSLGTHIVSMPAHIDSL